ncbi:hypothetical protein J4E90_008411 [Alternaria incomplexa]|uniref:uncharacterized protein n=1 Tax=Alternaria incomplexa TaxID=1187928 RepID=UPI00221FB8F2|nr:uncharacterized protein J4E90_008411 [Alternaria incomplexa]KAI4908679.1 hypothetical protein J4E90_008411 [Alternaria incomplexa]
MDSAEERPTLQETLNLLHQASRTTAKQRTVKVSNIVDVICRYASEDGLDQDALRDIVQLASVKTLLDQTTITTLIKNLYPSQKVPGDVVITIVGALGQGKGKPSPGTQDSLVKWLIAIHEVVEDSSVLSRLYGVLFGMLDMISIRTSLCHLLSLITRRKHVKPFRIQQLLELSRGLGNEPALQGLLRVYKDYYPDIILGSTSTSWKSFAPRPDAEWQARIVAIQEASVAEDDSNVDGQNGFKVLRRRLRGSKGSAIPDVHTYHATESSATLEGIDSVDDFVDKLDRIEPPGQLIALLVDPLLQKYVDLKPSPITAGRLGNWLATCLEEQFEEYRQGTGNEQYLSEVLGGLLTYAQYTKAKLVSYIPIEAFEDAHTTYLSAVERALAAHGLTAYTKLVDFYTSLLQHQITQTASGAADQRDTQQEVLSDLIEHVATLFTSALVSIPPGSSTTLTSSILSFYELLSTSSKPHVIPIHLPPMHLVYLLSQDASSTTLSRICGIIGSYKLAFDAHPKPVKTYYPAEVTDAFNWCLRDMYNLVWVSRGLLVQDQKSKGLYCDPILRGTLNEYLRRVDRGYTIGAAFALSYNAWLASLSAAAWRAVEKREVEKVGEKNVTRYHDGPVTEKSLEVLKSKGGVDADWEGADGYKVMVLQWLTERGLGGIRDLMFATVINLKGTA